MPQLSTRIRTLLVISSVAITAAASAWFITRETESAPPFVPYAAFVGARDGDDDQITAIAEWTEESAVRILPSDATTEEVVVEIRAVFGPLQRVIGSGAFLLAESPVISADFQAGLTLHPDQRHFVTQIRARATIIRDGLKVASQPLETRYLYLDESSGAATILSASEKEARFPDGVTSSSAAVHALSSEVAVDPAEGISLGIEPGVAIEEPIGTRIRPSDD